VYDIDFLNQIFVIMNKNNFVSPDAANQQIESDADQIASLKRLMYLFLPACIILSIWVIFDLNQLESGGADSVRLWAPVAFLYNQLGYWPAILFVPVLGLAVLGLLWRQIRLHPS